MAIWLLWGEESSHVKFHEMKWETVPENVVDVKFIRRAMTEGDVKDEYLSGVPWEEEEYNCTVTDVINRR